MALTPIECHLAINLTISSPWFIPGVPQCFCLSGSDELRPLQGSNEPAGPAKLNRPGCKGARPQIVAIDRKNGGVSWDARATRQLS